MTRILVVDDDPDIRELLAMTLELFGDFEVHTAADGEAGLATAIDIRPDLVVLDWMMPKWDGLEVCQRLRALPETSEIPVVLLTARAREADIHEGLDAGADDYVVKPFDVQNLVDRVRTLLARSG